MSMNGGGWRPEHGPAPSMAVLKDHQLQRLLQSPDPRLRAIGNRMQGLSQGLSADKDFAAFSVTAELELLAADSTPWPTPAQVSRSPSLETCSP